MITIDNEKAIMTFGSGDIGINTYIRIDTDEKGIIFYNQEPRKIGTMGDIKANTFVGNINDYPVKMVFPKIESIDVVIDMLEELKRIIINNEQSGGYIFECEDCGDMTHVSERKVVLNGKNICQECYNHLEFS